MCQAYEGEARMVTMMQRDDDEKGHPGGCSFQAGFFQCPNKYDRYAVTYRGREIRGTRVYGWECRTCGTFYPEKERVRESEAR